ncbi:hypothetical protein [Methylobacterium sp. WSM2598]|uniref:hypothetical protein n=1 Tax=Methylobacterium sp. WSM2598 TaxID=398261 RepID=UPI0006848872|nr:hypothetical protein [Methylobacterium sp. WSM2598]
MLAAVAVFDTIGGFSAHYIDVKGEVSHHVDALQAIMVLSNDDAIMRHDTAGYYVVARRNPEIEATWIGCYKPLPQGVVGRSGGYFGCGLWLFGTHLDGGEAVALLEAIIGRIESLLSSGLIRDTGALRLEDLEGDVSKLHDAERAQRSNRPRQGLSFTLLGTPAVIDLSREADSAALPDALTRAQRDGLFEPYAKVLIARDAAAMRGVRAPGPRLDARARGAAGEERERGSIWSGWRSPSAPPPDLARLPPPQALPPPRAEAGRAPSGLAEVQQAWQRQFGAVERRIDALDAALRLATRRNQAGLLALAGASAIGLGAVSWWGIASSPPPALTSSPGRPASGSPPLRSSADPAARQSGPPDAPRDRQDLPDSRTEAAPAQQDFGAVVGALEKSLLTLQGLIASNDLPKNLVAKHNLRGNFNEIIAALQPVGDFRVRELVDRLKPRAADEPAKVPNAEPTRRGSP